MIRKRLGKTLTFHWPIITNGEALALAGRTLTLYIIDPSGSPKETQFTINVDPAKANVADFTFQGREQTKPGVYGLELWENKDGINQTVMDRQNVFELVRYTKDEGNCGCKRY